MAEPKITRPEQYPEHECACEDCVNMCKRFPCRPLVAEVAALPPEQLMLNCYNGHDGRVEYLQPAGASWEGGHHYDETQGWSGSFLDVFMGRTPVRCTFLTEEGLCALHGACKPWEGRITLHQNAPGTKVEGDEETVLDLGFRDRASELLFEDWNTEAGREAVARWKAATGYTGRDDWDDEED